MSIINEGTNFTNTPQRTNANDEFSKTLEQVANTAKVPIEAGLVVLSSFQGADGGKYGFQGEPGKIYNLLTDTQFHVNALYETLPSIGEKDTGITELGFQAGHEQIHVAHNGTVTVNGEVLDLTEGETITIGDVEITKTSPWNYTFKSGEYESKIGIMPKWGLWINVRSSDANADGVLPHGLWGQTVDADNDPRFEIMGSYTDYEVSDIFDVDYKFSKFVVPIEVGYVQLSGFRGPDRDLYNVVGEAGKIYNLLTDTNVQINAKIDQFDFGKVSRNGLSELGIQAGHEQIHVTQDGAITVNGEVLDLTEGEAITIGEVEIVNEGVGKHLIKAGEYEVTVSALQLSLGSGGLRIDFASTNANADGVLPHGLWGQIVDADNIARRSGDPQGAGVIEGVYTDYEVSDIFDVDYKFSKFVVPIEVGYVQLSGFRGPDRDLYNVVGEAGKIYNLLTDTNVQINAKIDQFDFGKVSRNGLSELGIQAGHEQIHVTQDGAITVNGEVLDLTEGEAITIGEVEIVNEGVGKHLIKAGEYEVTVSALQLSLGSGGLRIDFASTNANADGVLPHGLWGQIVDADNIARRSGDPQGAGVIEGVYTDYEVSDIFDVDYKFSKFEILET